MSDRKPNCPRKPDTWCSRSKEDGTCCEVTPSHPISFRVVPRDSANGHWDVVTQWGRAFRIRDEDGQPIVTDERRGDEYGPFPRGWTKFCSLAVAMGFIADELMRPRDREAS